MVGAEALKRCKPTVRIVNIARGGIIDEEALLEALASGRCAGAALDVFAQEPPKEGSPSWKLIQHPLVVVTPHLGASTIEAQERVAKEIAEQLLDLIRGLGAVGIANAPNVARSLMDENKPWMQLAQAMGHLANCLAERFLTTGSDGQKTCVELVCCGEGTEDANLLASSALVGHLNGMKSNGINIVNAAVIGQDRGLTISARHDKNAVAKDLDKLLQLTVRRGSTVLQLIGNCVTTTKNPSYQIFLTK